MKHLSSKILQEIFSHTMILLFITIYLLLNAHYAHANSSISFTGNEVIDIQSSCSWSTGSSRTGAILTLKRDSVQVFTTSQETSNGRIDTLYRDTGLSKGKTYKYKNCCKYTLNTGKTTSEYCDSARSATTGEVGGTVRKNLTMSGGTISLDRSIRVERGISFTIDGAVIESSATYGSTISANSAPADQDMEPAVVSITNSTVNADIRLTFSGTNSYLLSDSKLNGTDLDVYDGAVSTISGNIFTSPEVNTSITVGGYGQATIRNNKFTGHFHEEYNRVSGTGIYIQESQNKPLPVVYIYDNTFSDFSDAIWFQGAAEATIKGNIVKNNIFGCRLIGAVSATITENTFVENDTGLSYSQADNLKINNNCIAGNTSQGLMNFSSSSDISTTALNITNNWWNSIAGPYHSEYNANGAGDRLYSNVSAAINFTPWLTESNCKTTPTPTLPEPATIKVTASSTKMPADGQSSTTLTVSLTDENQKPISNADISFSAPSFGILSSQSGTTNASGQLQIKYTAPTAEALKGKDYIELSAEYASDSIIDSVIINFTFATISIWADPHISAETSEVALIPGDERFPARYQFTLRDHSGQLVVDKELTISIADSSRARLESDNGQSGREITVNTDAQGKVSVDYIYLGNPAFSTPFEDTISIAYGGLKEPKKAKVSVGLDINIKNITPAERDTGVFPKTLGMRIEIEDTYRPDLDLRAYFNELEKISEQEVGMEVFVEWKNRPEPEFMDRFQAIFPNFGNDDPPELYDGLGVVNYGDRNMSEVLVEAMDTPNVSFGANTFPAITFTDPGNFWFVAYVEPIILPGDQGTKYEYIKGSRKDSDVGMIFGANILPEAESVFQSVVCSVKPTGIGQFVAMTALIDNPYFTILPPSIAVQMTIKASGIICDFMKGNYVTAAANMASFRIDGLSAAYGSGEGALNLLGVSAEQYERLQKLIKLNSHYSRIDNASGYLKDYFVPGAAALKTRQNNIKGKETRASNSQKFNTESLPSNLSVTQYQDIINKAIAGEMSAYTDMIGWQTLTILNKDTVSLTSRPDESEYFGHDGVHVFLLPPQANILNIKTTNNAQIFRHYLSSASEVFSADYTFAATEGSSSLLSLSLLSLGLNIDNGADGVIDKTLSPQINQVDATKTALDLSTNQVSYKPGDNFTLNASLTNPGKAINADIYFSITNSAGLHISIPDFSPGYTALATNVVIPANLETPEIPILSFPITAGFSGAGQFTIEAFLTYPGTMDKIGGNVDETLINFP